ncbi:hypothetical protein F4818DRAFT_445699 [Hypoxylon cercidicola]|nr:hypothetical protein F4818DRAFT_445699 [Hypoxylon cercidicola]
MTHSPVPDLPILIDAGVAGLTLAQGLRLRSIPFRLFERYPQSHTSQGHRFRMSNDGQSALNSVLSPQLQDLLRNTAAETQRFEPRYVDPRKLDFVKPTPVNLTSMPVDRTLIRMLTTLNIGDTIEYEKEFESYDVVDEQIQVKFADGSVACGQLLVGADGVRSRVRKQLQPDRKLLDLERWILPNIQPRRLLYTGCLNGYPESTKQCMTIYSVPAQHGASKATHSGSGRPAAR